MPNRLRIIWITLELSETKKVRSSDKCTCIIINVKTLLEIQKTLFQYGVVGFLFLNVSHKFLLAVYIFSTETAFTISNDGTFTIQLLLVISGTNSVIYNVISKT